MSTRLRRMRFAAIAGVIVLLGVVTAPRGGADVTLQYTDQTHWAFEITHMPDHDQKRGVLPNDGNNYCVPTATMNTMCYFANHGLPSLLPGPGYWQSPALYGLADDAITAMGVLMSTDPDDGTNGNGERAGLNVWLAAQPVSFIRMYSTTAFSPRLEHAAAFVFMGGYVNLSVGWYVEGTGGTMVRNGGHKVTLVAVERNGDDFLAAIRDPGSDENPDNLWGQSRFSTETYAVQDVLRVPTNYGFPRLMSKMFDYGNGYIDGLTVFLPHFALTTPPDPEMPGIDVLRTPMLDGAAVLAPAHFATAEAMPAIDLALHPDLLSCLYIADPPPGTLPPPPRRIWRQELATGECTQIDVGFVNPEAIMVGRRRDLYVLDDGDVVRVNLDADPPEEISRYPQPGIIAAMAYDDDLDELLLLSVEARHVARVPYHLDSLPRLITIPESVPLGGGASIAWNAPDNAAWVVTNASDSLWRLQEAAGVPIMIPMEIAHASLVAPTAVDVDDEGHVFVATGGHVLQFKQVTGEWMLDPEPMFAGADVGAFFRMASSHDNLDPALHLGPDHYDVFPVQFAAPVYDCDADVNGDRLVTVLDLLSLLANWGPTEHRGSIPEDIDQSARVDVLDLLLLLGAWGACP